MDDSIEVTIKLNTINQKSAGKSSVDGLKQAILREKWGSNRKDPVQKSKKTVKYLNGVASSRIDTGYNQTDAVSL